MKLALQSLTAVAGVLSMTASQAGDLTGRVATLAPFLESQNQLYVSLVDTPGNALPDGGSGASCSNQFAVANMSDANFRNFIYPLLLIAKSADAPITLRTRGCFGPHPIIVGVDYSPR